MAPAIRRLFGPFAGRDFRILWIGQSISSFGDALQVVAIIWLTLERTNAPTAVSGVLLAAGLPRTLLLLVGGVATDRYAPRTVMIFADVVRAVAVAMLVVLASMERLSLPLLFGLMSIQGAAGGIFAPASRSIVPQLVPSDMLQSANSLARLTPQVAIVLGSFLAGGLVAVIGTMGALTINAASYMIAVTFTAYLPELPAMHRTASRSSMFADAREGIAYVCRQPWLSALFLLNAWFALVVAGPLTVALPLLAKNDLTAGAQGYGLLMASFGAGSVAGLVLAGALLPVSRRIQIICIMALAQAPLFAGLGLLPLVPAALSLTAIGILNGVSEIAYLGLIQDHIPGRVLGRVMSVGMLASFSFQPVSQVVTGLLLSKTSVWMVFLATGVLIFLGALAILSVPSLRAVR